MDSFYSNKLRHSCFQICLPRHCRQERQSNRRLQFHLSFSFPRASFASPHLFASSFPFPPPSARVSKTSTPCKWRATIKYLRTENSTSNSIACAHPLTSLRATQPCNPTSWRGHPRRRRMMKRKIRIPNRCPSRHRNRHRHELACGEMVCEASKQNDLENVFVLRGFLLKMQNDIIIILIIS